LKRFAAAAKLMPLFGNVRERSFFWTQEKTPERLVLSQIFFFKNFVLLGR